MVDATLVTVHGFGSGPETWDRLRAVWQADDELEGLRVHAFGYLSPKKPPLSFSWTRISDFDDIAQLLATDYTTVLRRASSIAFVTHSQGGLILQRFLAWMISEGRARELSRIRTIVMLACPNGGSQFLDSTRHALGYRHHPQAAELEIHSKRVADTQRAVLSHIVHAPRLDDRNCPIPLHVYAGGSDAIVPAASAQAAFSGAGTLAGNHSTILDPAAFGNRTAEVIKQHILDDLSALPSAPLTPDNVESPGSDGPVAHPPEHAAADANRRLVRPRIVEVFDSTYQTEVVRRSFTIPVLVEMWAESSEPCRELNRILERLVTNSTGAWMLARVDVEANPELRALLAPQRIPTVEAMIRGQMVDGFSGLSPEAQLRPWISRVLQTARQLGL